MIRRPPRSTLSSSSAASDVYKRQIKDMVWLVRKSCVETIVEISKITDISLRNSNFTPIMLNFLKDENKWVKIAAYKNLGPFIASLEPTTIQDKLFEHYYSMIDNNVKNISAENEIMYACAFNFPGVLQAGGVERWPKFFKILQTLLKSPDKKIKKTLSYGLHEIAKIIGPDKAQKDIFPILTNLLKDNTDFIKYGVVKNLSSFLEIFDAQKREDLIDIFLQIQKNPHKWRIRKLIAKQISHLITLYSSETIFKIIVPISFKLCNDIVYVVRKHAAKQISSFLTVFNGEDESIYKEGVINNIKAFAISPRFNQRQAFVTMCEKLMFSKQLFLDQFYDTLKELLNDPIINVQISIAQCLYKHSLNAGPMADTDEFKNLLIQLSKQNCKEIQKLLKKIIQTGKFSKIKQSPDLSPLMKKDQTMQQEQQENTEQIEIEPNTNSNNNQIEDQTNIIGNQINSQQKLQNLEQNLDSIQNSLNDQQQTTVSECKQEEEKQEESIEEQQEEINIEEKQLETNPEKEMEETNIAIEN
eukprot:TRINITY_DN8005_c0_g1_i2.p1 TRINITY_DN8005_c0_g1~~TRINITY_DN8005_c0_g1_i2.p1  ORF type:complete len:529 (-),score=125.88 TRINITY_DN8005_c0_g1_i2:75-1661(-)